MVVLLEKTAIAERQLALYENGNAELQQQIDLLKEKQKLMQDIVTLQNVKIAVYQNMDEMNRKMAETQARIYEQQIRDAKPTFMSQVSTHTAAGVIGAILAGFAILLL
jgi:hypothetical protein